MVNAEEFSQAWRKIQEQELFELDIDDHTLLIGWSPEYTLEDEHEIFGSILRSSMAYHFLKAAWDYRQLKYVVAVSGIVVGFQTSFGWSFLTPNSYMAGNMPNNWRQLHQSGTNLLLSLTSDSADTDES